MNNMLSLHMENSIELAETVYPNTVFTGNKMTFIDNYFKVTVLDNYFGVTFR